MPHTISENNKEVYLHDRTNKTSMFGHLEFIIYFTLFCHLCHNKNNYIFHCRIQCICEFGNLELMSNTEIFQFISCVNEIYIVSIPVRDTMMSNISVTMSIVSPTSLSVEIFSAFCAFRMGISNLCGK